MKKLISVILLISFQLVTYSQQVISSAGETAVGSSVQLSWTIGETIIETFTGNTTTFTQGFHQSKLTVTAIDSVEVSGILVSVFPNPVNDKLIIEFGDFTEDKYSFIITDINSCLILKGRAVTNPQIIDMNIVKTGIYFLKIGTPTENRWKTCKIIKQ